MLPKFKHHIEDTLPFLKGKRLLLACSGGVDSVVLTRLSVSAGLDVTLAHCNFKLRGEESDGDEQFVRELASQLGLEIKVKAFDTYAYAKEHRGSIQMAARELRYQWFAELLESNGYDYLLTAHHADDDLETFLINLSRGTGLQGLLGIPVQNDKTMRPLLVFSRAEIMAFAQQEKMAWREDSSNSDSKYLRNKIRLEIVPKLKELHPTFLQNFIESQTHLEQADHLVKNHMVEIKKRLFQENGGDIEIKISELEKLKPLDAYLYGLFSDFGFTDWESVQGLMKAMSGKEVFSKTHRLLKDRELLILSKINSRVSETFLVLDKEVALEFPIKLKMENVQAFDKSAANTIYLDKEKLNFPLELRKWEKGDYFYPFGMKGGKKLSKFFKDEKMDVISKEKQWLLCSNDKIIWVVGKRTDERFKVDASTKNIVKITLIA